MQKSNQKKQRIYFTISFTKNLINLTENDSVMDLKMTRVIEMQHNKDADEKERMPWFMVASFWCISCNCPYQKNLVLYSSLFFKHVHYLREDLIIDEIIYLKGKKTVVFYHLLWKLRYLIARANTTAKRTQKPTTMTATTPRNSCLKPKWRFRNSFMLID